MNKTNEIIMYVVVITALASFTTLVFGLISLVWVSSETLQKVCWTSVILFGASILFAKYFAELIDEGE